MIPKCAVTFRNKKVIINKERFDSQLDRKRKEGYLPSFHLA
jgi:hypothetical protein